MKDKYLSIITNFGCHYTCPYCIVKKNGIKIPKTTIEGLKELESAIKTNECNWVSLSGGGDPLYNRNSEEVFDWYSKFNEIITHMNSFKSPENGIKIELHTSYIDAWKYYWAKSFSRIVYHLRDLEDIKKIVKNRKEIVRVVFVVTEDFTEQYVKDIVEEVKKNPYIDELSFRQMIDANYNTTDYLYDFLKSGHKKDWWYIEQGDYNLYYAENQISTKYEDFKNH